MGRLLIFAGEAAGPYIDKTTDKPKIDRYIDKTTDKPKIDR